MIEKAFQLKLDEELRKKLKKKSIDEGKSMNEIIVSLIKNYLK
jgi:hypothetical protein